jgi:hypothetical protein
MNKLILAFLILAQVCMAQDKGTKKKKADKSNVTHHYVCNLTNDVYHNMENCAVLQQCRGGRYRRVKELATFMPCGKCVRNTNSIDAPSGPSFADIKRVLGVRDKRQIADSLGTKKDVISRPGGVTMRLSGLPDSKRINSIEFFFSKPPGFNTDTLFSKMFYQNLGLNFEGCRADTIRNTTPHPVTGKMKQDVTIEYRGCAIVENDATPIEAVTHYYELLFVADDRMLPILLEKVQLTLKTER